MRRGDLPAEEALRIARARGFTLLEMAVVLVIIGIMYAIWSYSVPWLQDTGMRDRTREIMRETEKALLLFAETNNRLPCPDSTDPPNGLEGGGAAPSCTAGDAAVGQVPYETLLLSAPVQDSRHVPITYALYRNSGAADLGVLLNRIDTMDDVDESDAVTPTLNICDFCEALRLDEAASSSNGFASVSTQTTAAGGCGSGALLNQAYVLASSGLEDRDGVGGLFDGDNATATATAPCFASPEQGVSDTYDDVVSAVSFKHLIGELCRSPVCLYNLTPVFP
ncbi:MAG: prepilin-type N-terminal cleavage/methylation domain-containing protein [Arenicellales bacterium]